MRSNTVALMAMFFLCAFTGCGPPVESGLLITVLGPPAWPGDVTGMRVKFSGVATGFEQFSGKPLVSFPATFALRFSKGIEGSIGNCVAPQSGILPLGEKCAPAVLKRGQVTKITIDLRASVSAPSCERAAVQATLDGAGDGDIVSIPAGACSWTQMVEVPAKALDIVGAGIDKTVIMEDVALGGGGAALLINVGPRMRFRLSNLTIKMGTGAAHAARTVVVDGVSEAWRIDHVKLGRVGFDAALRIYGHTFGVVDHSQFELEAGATGIAVGHDGWDGGSHGDGSWAAAAPLGTEKAVFIEDNVFTSAAGSVAVIGGAGGRFVVRHNTMSRTSVGGGTPPRDRRERSYEIYENDFDFDPLSQFADPQVNTAVGVEGGTGVIFKNSFKSVYRGIVAVEPRIDQAVAPWGKCDGTGPYDGTGPGGYPCIDQVGYGTGTLISGAAPVPVGSLNQAQEPVYAWLNTLNRLRDGTGKIESGALVHIIEDRDFFNNVEKPGYKPYGYPHPLVGP